MTDLYFIRLARDRVNAAATDAVDLSETGRFADALDAVDQAIRYAEDLKKQIRARKRAR